MSEHQHDHGHDHDHGEGHGMSPYQFFQTILAGPMDETLLYNVTSPEFWEGVKPDLENERTADALEHLDEAVKVLAWIPEERRKMILDYEYAMSFLSPDSSMSPLERSHDMPDDPVADWARSLGVLSAINRFLPDDHIANELGMLVPLDSSQEPTPEQLELLAQFFEKHPLQLAKRMAESKRQRAEGSGFYRGIVELMAAWLQWDLDAFEG